MNDEDVTTSQNLNQKPHCHICAGYSERAVEGIFDTRFGIPGKYDVYRCQNCGLEQTLPRPDATRLKELYEKYYNFNGTQHSLYTRARDWFLSSPLYRLWLGVDGDISFHNYRGQGRLLDVGCNEGRGLTLYQRNGFVPEGLEINDQAARVAREKGFVVHAQLLEQFSPEKSYDVVVLSNVLEHALDPVDMLNQVRRILAPEGRVLISCPNSESLWRTIFGRYWINWHVPFHISHFSVNMLKKLLREAGFEGVKIKVETPALWIAQSLLARFAAKPGRVNRMLRSPLEVAFLMLIIRGLLFPFLWLANQLGQGDCLVVVAEVGGHRR